MDKNKLETRHSQRGDFMWWVKFVLWNELALAYDGKISDEGVSGCWKGEEGKYSTFSDDVEKRLPNQVGYEPAVLNWLRQHMMEEAPKNCPASILGKSNESRESTL